MSKYIRTKNGIYEAVIKDLYGNYYDETETAILVEEQRRFYLLKKDIIAKADTIEELCDEAVAVYPDGTHDNCSVMHIVDNNGFCEAVYGCLSVSVDDLKKDYECWEIYGAIWTDKGLIYVAKMNENGELVLI